MRLIDADKMIGDGENSFPYNLDFCDTGDIDRWVLSQPIIDAEPVVHAHWVKNIHHEQECSRCGGIVCKDAELCIAVCDYDYRPNCGAKMDAEQKLLIVLRKAVIGNETD